MLKIITISGVDGSGKSTQASLLTDHLREQGFRVFYFHAVQFSLAKKIAGFKRYCLLCRLSGKCQTESRDQEEKSVTRANSLQIFFRKLFLGIDLWRFRRLKEKLERQGYDYLLSDRYFFDSIVNIGYLEKKEYDREIPFFAKPDKAFYIDVSPETIMDRERKPDQGAEYLIKKQEIFGRYNDKWNMAAIDGNKEKGEVFEDIVSCLE